MNDPHRTVVYMAPRQLYRDGVPSEFSRRHPARGQGRVVMTWGWLVLLLVSLGLWGVLILAARALWSLIVRIAGGG